MLTASGDSAAALARDLERRLAEYRAPVAEALARMLPAGDSPVGAALYAPIRSHALAVGKGLRPSLCIATCRALGGGLEAVLPTAAVLELYHNAFLVHDDVEDGSLLRRDAPTLHQRLGMASAVNAGDAMLAIALGPLLENTRLVGVGKALRVLEIVARLARESAEGQAIELDWVRRGALVVDEDAYVAMVEKKTAYYSFVAPVELGGAVAGAPAAVVEALARYGRSLGVAFQIHDDVLNLGRAGGRWGKEPLDDLWEGKRTLVLSHALRHASDDERARAAIVLGKRRPTEREARLAATLGRLEAAGALGGGARRELEAALAASHDGAAAVGVRDADDVAFLHGLIERAGSLDHAERVAARHAAAAHRALCACSDALAASDHRDLLFALVEYVRRRDH